MSGCQGAWPHFRENCHQPPLARPGHAPCPSGRRQHCGRRAHNSSVKQGELRFLAPTPGASFSGKRSPQPERRQRGPGAPSFSRRFSPKTQPSPGQHNALCRVLCLRRRRRAGGASRETAEDAICHHRSRGNGGDACVISCRKPHRCGRSGVMTSSQQGRDNWF